MGKNDENIITEKDIARFCFTSMERVEDFIDRWMKYHQATRQDALKKLEQLDIDLSKISGKKSVLSDHREQEL